MNNWLYEGNPFDPSEEERKKWVGFVYNITNLKTGMMYIGKKKLWSKITRPPLKGKTRKRRSVKESDWKKYHGSSESLKLLIEEEGSDNFKREVLRLCVSAGELNYMEAYYQIVNHVMLRPDKFYNKFVGMKCHQSHVKKIDIQSIKNIKF